MHSLRRRYCATAPSLPRPIAFVEVVLPRVMWPWSLLSLRQLWPIFPYFTFWVPAARSTPSDRTTSADWERPWLHRRASHRFGDADRFGATLDSRQKTASHPSYQLHKFPYHDSVKRVLIVDDDPKGVRDAWAYGMCPLWRQPSASARDPPLVILSCEDSEGSQAAHSEILRRLRASG